MTSERTSNTTTTQARSASTIATFDDFDAADKAAQDEFLRAQLRNAAVRAIVGGRAYREGER